MNQRKTYKPWSPTQTFLLPPSPMDWLPEGHLAYFILDVVSELDLSEIHQSLQQRDARGTRGYNPEMMVALVLYGYSVGVFSSRKMARATFEDVAFRVLAAGQHPHFTTINSFRKEHLAVLRSLFLQVLKICQTAGLVKLGLLALDGTKVQANASKHKAMSYDRMLKTELQLVEEIEALLARAKQTDLEEDERFGEGKDAEDLPAELKRRESRLATIREAKQRLEQESRLARARALREQATRASESAVTAPTQRERKKAARRAKTRIKGARKLDSDSDDDDIEPPKTGTGLEMHEPRVKPDGKPHDKAQMNFTDPDSRLMKGGGSFVQAYNCQALVDSAFQVIVGQALSNRGSDNDALVPMIAQGIENIGEVPDVVVADAGYWHPDAPEGASELGVEALISTNKRKDDQPLTVQEAESSIEAMRNKLKEDSARELYARRKAVVEPVFGQIKEARGFRRFLLKGLENVEAEWALLCTTHNLLKLWRNGELQTA